MYTCIKVSEIASAISLYDEGKISLRALQLYFAAQEAKASREAAFRSERKKGRQGRGGVRFSLEEFARALACPETEVRKAARQLKHSGLGILSPAAINFFSVDEGFLLSSELAGGRSVKRPVPIPRRVLKFLSRCKSPTLIKVTLAYLIRGLTISRVGEIKNAGSVKVSWISYVLNVSERAVRYARAKLLSLGMLSDDEGSSQLKLNRTGAYFTVNMDWRPPSGNLHPTPCKIGGSFAPPIENKKTPNGSKDQKTSSGLCMANGGKESMPSIKNVNFDDLQSFSRTEELYLQAVRTGILQNSEATKLNFFSAAVRAKTCKARDPVKVFMGIVRKGLWMNITQAEEERARVAISRRREGCGALSIEDLLGGM